MYNVKVLRPQPAWLGHCCLRRVAIVVKRYFLPPDFLALTIVYNLSDDAAPVIAQNAELLKMKKDSIEDDRAFHEMENDEWWYDTFLNQIRIFNASEAAARRYYGG